MAELVTCPSRDTVYSENIEVFKGRSKIKTIGGVYERNGSLVLCDMVD